MFDNDIVHIINRAINWFIDHSGDPTWKPTYKPNHRLKEQNNADESLRVSRRMYAFLVPLQDGRIIAKLHMPPALTKQEAERLHVYLESIVIE